MGDIPQSRPLEPTISPIRQVNAPTRMTSGVHRMAEMAWPRGAVDAEVQVVCDSWASQSGLAFLAIERSLDGGRSWHVWWGGTIALGTVGRDAQLPRVGVRMTQYTEVPTHVRAYLKTETVSEIGVDLVVR